MRAPQLAFVTVLAALLAALAPARAHAALPAGFAADAVAGAWDIPTAIAFAPDGRLFVAEKAGRLWLVEHGVRRPTPVWDGRDIVLANGDRGLTGLAVDPGFLQNHRIYLAYTVDPDLDGVDDDPYAFGRIVRYTMSEADSNVVDPESEVVLIGDGWADGVLNAGQVHTVDGLRFGADGTLLASMGDGALYLNYDRGRITPELFSVGRGDTLEDIGMFRAQSLQSYGGKLLRMDPGTGFGLPSNPFWDGDSTSKRSRIWMTGLRNPWRFTVRPGTGSPDPADARPGQVLIGDVGLETWEGVVAADSGGVNAGWPCWEAVDSMAITRQLPPRRCPCDSLDDEHPRPRTPPAAWFHHHDPQLSEPQGAIGNSITMGAFYTGTRYPEAYRGQLFLGDFGQQWIRTTSVDSTGHLAPLAVFGSSMQGPVDFAADPVTGDLHYVAINAGEVRRLRYTEPGDLPPRGVIRADSLVGAGPFTLGVTADSLFDAEGDSIAVRWDFGDGAGAAGVAATHTFALPATYRVILTLEDARGAVARETTTVAVFQSPAFPTTPSLDGFADSDTTFSEEWAISPIGVTRQGGRLLADQPGTWALRDSVFASGLVEAHATLADPPPGGALGLLLDVQGAEPASGAIRVLFVPADSAVRIESLRPGESWQTHATFALPPLAAGERLGARALLTGDVQVFADGAELGRANVAGWPWIGTGGRIGVAFEGGPTDTLAVDDFGGGDASLGGDTAPAIQVLAPADSSFYAAGDTIAFSALVSDAEDPADSLTVRWTVDLRHNNHIHPAILTLDGAEASFVAVEHEDGTGTNMVVHAKVTDRAGFSTTVNRILYPEVDLVPVALTHEPDTLDDLHAISWTAGIANHGRMPAPWSRWRLLVRTSDGRVKLLGEGDVQPAAAETSWVTFSSAAIPWPGDATFRLVADTLAAVTETSETNDALTFGENVQALVNGVPVLPVRTALGPPRPNPWRESVSFALALADEGGAGTRVQLKVFDVAGRVVARREFGRLRPGETTLTWDGRDDAGRATRPGLYFVRVEAGRSRFDARLVRLP